MRFSVLSSKWEGDLIMSIKTVLSILDVNQFNDDLKCAVDFCHSHDAHLTALLIAMCATPHFSSYESLADRLDRRVRDTENLTEKACDVRTLVKGSIRSYEVQEIYTEYAWADEDIAERAHYVDLVLVGAQAAHNDLLRQRVVDGALLQSPTPVLINPTNKHLGEAPKVVLLAWDSSEAAARATRQSIDFLQAAGTVHVTLVEAPSLHAAGYEEQGANISKFLERHGVRVSLDCISDNGHSVENALRKHAVEIGAGMIVMGAYSHPRLRQRLFGGVTQSMLSDLDLPLFLAH